MEPQAHLVYEATTWTVSYFLQGKSQHVLTPFKRRTQAQSLKAQFDTCPVSTNFTTSVTMLSTKRLPIPPRVSISSLKLVLPDACVPEPVPLAESLFCLLLGPTLSVLDAVESLIPLVSDARPESLDGLLTVSAADVTVLEAVVVEVDRLSLDVGAGGVDVVVVDNFFFSSLNCSCCFRAKEQQHVRQHSLKNN